MWKYFDNLPLKDRSNIASLGEGDTALVPSRRIGPSLGLDQLYFKLEFQNPRDPTRTVSPAWPPP